MLTAPSYFVQPLRCSRSMLLYALCSFTAQSTIFYKYYILQKAPPFLLRAMRFSVFFFVVWCIVGFIVCFIFCLRLLIAACIHQS